MSFSKLFTITLAISTLAQTAWAEPVSLKSTTSSVELVGELISFDGEVYVIETDIGELEVDARTVTCAGKSCPEIKITASEISVFGSQVLIHQLFIPLLENYSFSLDAAINTTLQGDDKSLIEITAKDGQEFASLSVHSGSASDLKTDLSKTRGVLTLKTASANAMATAQKDSDIVFLATDAMVAITSDTNAVKTISPETLRRVLSGTITNWKDLGGPDVDISLYLPEQSSNLVEIIKNLGFDISKSKTAIRFDDLKALSTAAANDPYGLGVTTFSNLRTAKALSIAGSCGAYSRPDTFSISSGRYPAVFYHYLQAAPGTLPIFAREFLSYLSEDQAKAMIDRQGYPSLSVIENGLENQGNRIVHGLLATEKSIPIDDFRIMMKTLNGARQLSTVLRFTPGSKNLNRPSSAALDALISELFLGRFADQTLIIAGFTGSKGSNDTNKSKSKTTAQSIADYIKASDTSGLLADLQIKVLGFGKASPLTCEDTPQGTAINNRVEIWVKDAL